MIITNNTQHAKHGRMGRCSSKSNGEVQVPTRRNFREKENIVKTVEAMKEDGESEKGSDSQKGGDSANVDMQ